MNSEEYSEFSYDLPSIDDEDEGNNLSASDEGWQVQGGKKKLKEYIYNNLQHVPPLSEKTALDILDIWKIREIGTRWGLYRFWLNRYIESKIKESSEIQNQLKKEYKDLCEMRTEEDVYVCKRAHILGMTTTGAAKYRHILQSVNPKIVIVEEAAEILESHIVTSLTPATQHIILIGDHQQLRPNPTVHLLAIKYDLNVSLFERMLENGMTYYKLGIQHRMRPEIASLLVPHIYANLQNHSVVTTFENIKGMSKNVYFVTHNFNELQEYDSKSKVNEYEARFLIKMCKYLIMQGYSTTQITVLTTYSGQLFALKNLASNKIFAGIKFTVVDNYQGEENDVILISFVRSNVEGEIGFLKVSNRVCVALSRARKGLYCIGNFELLSEKSDLWKKIVCTLKKEEAIGSSIVLSCQQHPENIKIIANEKDFDSVAEGGCTLKCEFRFSCGHACILNCHPYDKEHETIRCEKPCSKKCVDGHVCRKKCFQKCGNCTFLVDKKLDRCDHNVQVFCYQKTEPIPCSKLCEKYLSCGHMCSGKCSESCVDKCKEKIKIKSPICGHKVITECFNFDNVQLLSEKCKKACQTFLTCGHLCKGTCSSCHQGRLHVACKQRCKRILVCGHECTWPCSENCPPCKRRCENKCTHSKCPKTCGEPCDICSEPCEWYCEHKKCTKLCGELCDRTPCEEPCEKKLSCAHNCIGLCGEPCPTECKVCHENQVKEVFFGTEDDSNARFVCLEDCGHNFEVGGLTQWMSQNENAISLKNCPKCKTAVRKNLRFGNLVKMRLLDIEKVKKITFGNEAQNKKLQDKLLLMADSVIVSFVLAEKFMSVLEPSLSRNIKELTILENFIKIISLNKSLFKPDPFLNRRFMSIGMKDTVVRNTNKNLEKYIEINMKWVLHFIDKKLLTASEQQLHEFSWEVHRLALVYKLSNFIQKEERNLKSNEVLNDLVASLTTYAPFQSDDDKKFAINYQCFVKEASGTVVNISDIEKQSILKAMSLSKGHWYQCPNGHVCCITECRGAMEKSKCSECGEVIGGINHSLIANNRVATAMDGAEHPAWSEAMNIEN